MVLREMHGPEQVDFLPRHTAEHRIGCGQLLEVPIRLVLAVSMSYEVLHQAPGKYSCIIFISCRRKDQSSSGFRTPSISNIWHLRSSNTASKSIVTVIYPHHTSG
jgi:hypothetical protein